MAAMPSRHWSWAPLQICSCWNPGERPSCRAAASSAHLYSLTEKIRHTGIHHPGLGECFVMVLVFPLVRQAPTNYPVAFAAKRITP